MNPYFGKSIALDRDDLVVGATPARFEAIDTRGGVYRFSRTTSPAFTEVALVPGLELLQGDDVRFGHSVAVAGDVIVVGAPYALSDADQVGAAVILPR